MVTGFWKNLKKPIYALAPMADVTDAAFRQIIAKYGKPDIMFTEFVSCDGLQSTGQAKLLVDFIFEESQRPIVAQIFGSKPDNFYKTALLVQKLGFDGIDINMGCPDRKVEKQGAGAALIKTPKLAQEIVAATKKGAGNLPVSIKTRIGYAKNELDTWLPALLATDVVAITLHARTRKEMSSVPAHWNVIADAVKIRNSYDNSEDKTLILGNGDVLSIAEAKEKLKKTNADGIMIGKGIFGNPWLFKDCHVRHYEEAEGRRSNPVGLVNTNPTESRLSRDNADCAPGSQFSQNDAAKNRLLVMVEHTKLFEKLLGEHKNFGIMKKHYKAYVTGWQGAKDLRAKLMDNASDATAVEKIVNEYLKN
jgi:nifR3 family TIM-barrel protein